VFTGAMAGSFLHLYHQAASHEHHEASVQQHEHEESGICWGEAEHQHHCGLCEFQFVIFTAPDWQMSLVKFPKNSPASVEFHFAGADSRHFTPNAPARAPPAEV
jgi:hypothetical protein